MGVIRGGDQDGIDLLQELEEVRAAMYAVARRYVLGDMPGSNRKWLPGAPGRLWWPPANALLEKSARSRRCLDEAHYR